MMNREGPTILRLLAVLSILVLTASESGLAQQSTTGPVPLPGTDRGLRAPDRTRVTIPEVPAYVWHHGCGPTAVGMVIGYWDGHGYPLLVPGSAASQTAQVDAMIASDGGQPDCGLPDGNHYQDYSCPIDDFGPLMPDRSQTGGAHASNCVGDFMHTSWSLDSNRYGWSWNYRVPSSFIDYVHSATSYQPTAQTMHISQLSWSAYRAEIDSLQPMVFLVDTDGDGETDHFVTAIGYDNATNEYGIRDTWDTGVHWYAWRPMAPGTPWGIGYATALSVGNATTALAEAPATVQESAVVIEHDGPNPFSPQTSIKFRLRDPGRVNVSVYDIEGWRVVTLASGEQERGDHAVTWDGRDLAGRDSPSGIYIIRVEVGGASRTQKVVLVR